MSLAKWEMVDLANKQGRHNSSVSINEGAASTGGKFSVEPVINGVRIKP